MPLICLVARVRLNFMRIAPIVRALQVNGALREIAAELPLIFLVRSSTRTNLEQFVDVTLADSGLQEKTAVPGWVRTCCALWLKHARCLLANVNGSGIVKRLDVSL